MSSALAPTVHASTVNSPELRAVTHVTSEIAYDLFQDHFDVMLELLEQPMDEVTLLQHLAATDAPATLQRLLAHHLIKRYKGKFVATADVFQQMRQEGMRTFLQRYLLPALSATDDDGADGSVEQAVGIASLKQHHLHLPVATIKRLRSTHVAKLYDAITRISDTPIEGPAFRMSIILVGCMDLQNAPTPLALVREAGLRRSHPDKQNEALLSQIDLLADNNRFTAIQLELERFVVNLLQLQHTQTLPLRQSDNVLAQELDSDYRSPPVPHKNQAYSLLIGSHWQMPKPAQPDHNTNFINFSAKPDQNQACYAATTATGSIH